MIEGRGLVALATIAAGELVAIKGGHIISTSAMRSLPERLQNSEIQIADGFHLAGTGSARTCSASTAVTSPPTSFPGWPTSQTSKTMT